MSTISAKQGYYYPSAEQMIEGARKNRWGSCVKTISEKPEGQPLRTGAISPATTSTGESNPASESSRANSISSDDGCTRRSPQVTSNKSDSVSPGPSLAGRVTDIDRSNTEVSNGCQMVWGLVAIASFVGSVALAILNAPILATIGCAGFSLFSTIMWFAYSNSEYAQGSGR